MSGPARGGGLCLADQDGGAELVPGGGHAAGGKSVTCRRSTLASGALTPTHWDPIQWRKFNWLGPPLTRMLADARSVRARAAF